jgi:hypothetical protein
MTEYTTEETTRMLRQSEERERQIGMFGMTTDQVRDAIEKTLAQFTLAEQGKEERAVNLAVSMLSDIQHHEGISDKTRMAINRVKILLTDYAIK